MSNHTIDLGGQQHSIAAIPLGNLRRLVPAFHRAGRSFATGQIEESTFDDIFSIISLATGLPVAEVEAMPNVEVPQLMAAVEAIADVCGLKPKGGQPPGEARPGSASPA